MEYIARDLEPVVERLSGECACVFVVGPRQVGKTAMLRHLDSARRFVTLDDLENRALAKRDPEFFLQANPAPCLIDEVQYVPELFPYLKIAVDIGVWVEASSARGR